MFVPAKDCAYVVFLNTSILILSNDYGLHVGLRNLSLDTNGFLAPNDRGSCMFGQRHEPREAKVDADSLTA